VPDQVPEFISRKPSALSVAVILFMRGILP
jgi:hypothetical protein